MEKPNVVSVYSMVQNDLHVKGFEGDEYIVLINCAVIILSLFT